MKYIVWELIIWLWKIFWIELINMDYYSIRPVYYKGKLINIIVDKPTWIWMIWKTLEIDTK